MDKSLPQAGSGTDQNVVSPTQLPASASQSQTAPRSSLADDMLKAQRDLAAAASGKPVSVADADQDLPPPPKPEPNEPMASLPIEPLEPIQQAKPMPPPVSVPKEQRELGPATEPEKVPIAEYQEPEPGPEVKDWMQKLEEGETIQLPQPVTDDYGQVLVQSAGSQKPKIVLPLDEDEVIEGLHQKVINSLRWLAEWCVRVMKKASGRVFYKPTEETV